jgi:hypothetical protein
MAALGSTAAAAGVAPTVSAESQAPVPSHVMAALGSTAWHAAALVNAGMGATSSALARERTDWVRQLMEQEEPEFATANSSRFDEERAEANECVACLDDYANVCLIPCGHVCLCVACACKLDEPSRCPLCRVPIEGAAKTVKRQL